MKSRKTEANMTELSKLVFSFCNLLCCVDWGDTASRVFIIPQFCKHFKCGSPNLSKALLHLQLCKYFLNEKFFEMLRKVCGGSNPATDPKCPKCIYKTPKNFRVEKSGEISRNLRFSRFFVPASKSDTHHGWDSWTRTSEMQESKSCALPTWLYPNIFLPIFYHT